MGGIGSFLPLPLYAPCWIACYAHNSLAFWEIYIVGNLRFWRNCESSIQFLSFQWCPFSLSFLFFVGGISFGQIWSDCNCFCSIRVLLKKCVILLNFNQKVRGLVLDLFLYTLSKLGIFVTIASLDPGTVFHVLTGVISKYTIQKLDSKLCIIIIIFIVFIVILTI